MTPALLAPLFLAGLGLAIVPFLIHRIRRPERKPLAFSSLMFVPRLDEQVIEKRRLQHLLLMCLRIAALALLAFAFGRPFLPSGSAHTGGEDAATLHVLLVDQSLSMATGERMSEARARALEVLDRIPRDEPVALVTFGAEARVLVPFGTGESVPEDHRGALRRGIGSIEATQQATRYANGLAASEALLRTRASDVPMSRGVIHLFGDLQEAGFGNSAPPGWTSPPEIEVRPHALAADDAPNRSVVDVAVRPASEGGFRIAARIRNWNAPSDADFAARLFVSGKNESEQPVRVLRHHAGQVVFGFTPEAAGAFDGWIEIEDDALGADNRRFFAWAPAPVPRVQVLESGSGVGDAPTAWFAKAAIEGAGRPVFEVSTLRPEQWVALAGEAGAHPDVVICGGLGGSDPGLADALLAYVAAGGRLMLALSPAASAAELNARFLSRLGLVPEEPPQSGVSSAPYSLLDWIDYEHPLFREFRSPRYNDFSQIRVFEYQPVQEPGPAPESEGPRRVLARLESRDPRRPGPPALIEIAHGDGRIMLWTFPFDPRATNFPKSSRFAPIVHETLRYLAGESDTLHALSIGERVSAGEVGDTLQLRDGGDVAQRYTFASSDDVPLVIERAGVVTVQGAGETFHRVYGVANLDASESDPVRLAPEAFLSRVASPAASPPRARLGSLAPLRAGRATGEAGVEFGLLLLAAVLGLMIVELWYAPRIVR